MFFDLILQNCVQLPLNMIKYFFLYIYYEIFDRLNWFLTSLFLEKYLGNFPLYLFLLQISVPIDIFPGSHLCFELFHCSGKTCTSSYLKEILHSFIGSCYLPGLKPVPLVKKTGNNHEKSRSGAAGNWTGVYGLMVKCANCYTTTTSHHYCVHFKKGKLNTLNFQVVATVELESSTYERVSAVIKL